ncbi:hypothetical protein [Vibrio phage vB_pir03]|nr:hypothetical protein [Vibrio phage vB_pir03]
MATNLEIKTGLMESHTDFPIRICPIDALPGYKQVILTRRTDFEIQRVKSLLCQWVDFCRAEEEFKPRMMVAAHNPSDDNDDDFCFKPYVRTEGALREYVVVMDGGEEQTLGFKWDRCVIALENKYLEHFWQFSRLFWQLQRIAHHSPMLGTRTTLVKDLDTIKAYCEDTLNMQTTARTFTANYQNGKTVDCAIPVDYDGSVQMLTFKAGLDQWLKSTGEI